MNILQGLLLRSLRMAVSTMDRKLMEFAVDGASILFKMEGIIRDNGKIAKCTELENYIINRKSLHMMEIGSKVNFQEKGSFTINIP